MTLKRMVKGVSWTGQASSCTLKSEWAEGGNSEQEKTNEQNA